MKPCHSPAQHLPEEAGLRTGIPPTARFTNQERANSPRPGPPPGHRGRDTAEPWKGTAGGRNEAAPRWTREGARRPGGGGGRGRRLTWRGATPDACCVSAACAASPLRATAPPCSRSGRSCQRSGSPAPDSDFDPVAPAPPKAPAAAGSASALATSPSFGRAVAGPAA